MAARRNYSDGLHIVNKSESVITIQKDELKNCTLELVDKLEPDTDFFIKCNKENHFKNVDYCIILITKEFWWFIRTFKKGITTKIIVYPEGDQGDIVAENGDLVKSAIPGTNLTVSVNAEEYCITIE